MKEEDMNDVVIDYFENRGFVTFEEVPANQKRIDLYFIHRNYPKTIAVELKIRKWKQALRQAYQNLFFAQKSYVGLWHEFLNEKVISEISIYGIGIIKINSDSVELIAKPDSRLYGILPSTWNILDEMTSQKDNVFLWREKSADIC
jgi:hypothetical protein